MQKLYYHKQTGDLSSIVSDAVSELTSLGEEMQSWADNMQDTLSATEKFSQVEEAASALNDIDEPDVPDALQVIEVEWSIASTRKGRIVVETRAMRRDNAIAQLQAAIEALQAIEADDPLNEDAETLADELQNIVDTVEGVEFPGMY